MTEYEGIRQLREAARAASWSMRDIMAEHEAAALAAELRAKLDADEAALHGQPATFRRDQGLLVIVLRRMLVDIAASLPARYGRPLLYRSKGEWGS